MLTISNPENLNWADLPLHELLLGNSLDTLITFQYWKKAKKELKQDIVFKLLNDVTPIFNKMEVNGLDIDKSKLDNLVKRSDEALTEFLAKIQGNPLVAEFTKLVEISELNPNSSKQMNSFLVDFIPIAIHRYNGDKDEAILDEENICDYFLLERSKKTDNVSFDEANLKKLIVGLSKRENKNLGEEQLLDLLKAISGYKHLAKLYNSYIEEAQFIIDNVNKHNKLYCKYNLTGTVTGRISCAAVSFGKVKRGISMHTLPRDEEYNMRSVITPSKEEIDQGYVFVTVDYSTMEMRVVAEISKDRELLSAFHNNLDLHSFTASKIYKKPISMISKEERNVGKTINFTILYGGGPYKLSEELGCSPHEGKELIKDYFTTFKGLKAWKSRLEKEIIQNGYVQNIFGRVRRSPTPPHSLSKRDKSTIIRQLTNSVIQSSASDILLMKLVQLDSHISSLGGRMVATVHDSVEFVIPKQQLPGFKPSILTSDEFKQLTVSKNWDVPLVCEVKVGKSFGENIEMIYNGDTCTNMDEVLEYLKCIEMR